ncbi:MAG: hypothetical protein HQL22_09590 [Candidatus Omnitrophica bacterium]|nr:hypothetical protein [Candidatus Omnitrophota bacterium]
MQEFPMFEWLLKGPATLCGCLVVVGFLWYRLRIQEQHLWVLSSFVGTLFRRSVILSKLAEEPSNKTEEAVFYDYLLSSVQSDFENMYGELYKKSLLSKYNLFFEENHCPSSFGIIYEDLFVRMIKEQFSEWRSGNFSDEDRKKLALILKKHKDFRKRMSLI